MTSVNSIFRLDNVNNLIIIVLFTNFSDVLAIGMQKMYSWVIFLFYITKRTGLFVKFPNSLINKSRIKSASAIIKVGRVP